MCSIDLPDDALDDLVTSLIARSAGMERGSAFESVHSELLDTVTNYVGWAEESLDVAAAAAIHANLEEWFGNALNPVRFLSPALSLYGRPPAFLLDQ